MQVTSENVSRTRALTAKVMHAVFKFLDERGSARRSEVLEHIAQSVSFDEWEAGRLQSGQIRWQVNLSFYIIDAIKGGLLVKRSGTWYLTPEGREALKLGPIALEKLLRTAYAKWRKLRNEQIEATGVETTIEVEDSDAAELSEALDEVRDRAAQALRQRVWKMSPYEFQDLTAALLRGMGYSTPVVTPPGRDGGLDIVAYRDPLGTVPPRIKVQVKHRQSPASVQEVRELMGLLQRDSDVGVFISSGGFTPDAKATARSSSVHLELVDIDRFLELWQQFYDRLSEGDKRLLPLIPVYFLDPA